MTDNLPELRRPTTEGAVSKPVPSKRRKRKGGFAFADLLRDLGSWEDLPPGLEEWEVQYAAVGAVTAVAVAGISLTLPEPASITSEGFDLFGVASQEIAIASGLLESLVTVIRALTWPLAVLGVGGLILDAYLAVRARQPIGLHYVCVGQMLLGFLTGISVAAIYCIVLANIVTGLLAAALMVIVVIAMLGITVAILSVFSDS